MQQSLFGNYANKKKRKSQTGASSSKEEKKKKKKIYPTNIGKYKYSGSEITYLKATGEGSLKKDVFEFIGSVPSKKNSRITSRKTGRSFPNPRYTGWYYAMMQQIQYINISDTRELFSNNFKNLAVTIYFPTYAIADLTNKTESVMDFLVDEYEHEGSKLEGEFLPDDNWKETGEILLIPEYRKGIGGFKIEPLEEFIKNKYQHLFKNSLHEESY